MKTSYTSLKKAAALLVALPLATFGLTVLP